MGGSLSSCTSWFNQYHGPNRESSAHYGVNDFGLVHQYVALENTAYANGIRESGNIWPGSQTQPVNHQCITIETEDHNDNSHPVTPKQYQSVKYLCQTALARYPTIRWLCTHRSISPLSRPICPGARWTQTGKFQQLGSELGLTIYV